MQGEITHSKCDKRDNFESLQTVEMISVCVLMLTYICFPFRMTVVQFRLVGFVSVHTVA